MSKIGYRPTWAEVNLSNLSYNFKKIKSLLSSDTKVMACVKADAYGHGIIPVSKKLESLGVDCLGVASIDEGIALRKAGLKSQILILGLILKEDIEPLFKYRITPTVCVDELARVLNKRACSKKISIPVHIKLDTGMGRVGVLYDQAFNFIRRVQRLKYIRIQGIFTHFPLADVDDDFTRKQIRMLDLFLSDLEKEGTNIAIVHIANSMGVVGYQDSHFNMVRPGLVLYGLYPEYNFPAKAGSRNMREEIKLKPVLSLKTRVIYVKRVPKGYGISYGHTYVTKKESTIVTLPIGYGDGYPRNLSNKAPVLIKGERFKVSGRVCMDQMMVDVGDHKIKVGDEAVLIGSQAKFKITAEELARLSETISYEIACGLGSRIPRVYLD
ncbi:MAG: alanine racemase [Candidatus Omnitrophota bacterium]|nr:alanine racemase [Candidatus Omnitrophota bacterium]MBU1928587.1 alanine racemase [Candidatus Omnitrophota bacterium]MBU2034600.1 alanine racemase [Candidatus Omnitrophota bacterium]MBU2221971.1 alanine racemase [Candidatus Omnitrophota bacterium]MBU2257896.1 alanine racemase [Candidatus Omnitrophota bacterium]